MVIRDERFVGITRPVQVVVRVARKPADELRAVVEAESFPAHHTEVGDDPRMEIIRRNG